MNREYMYMIAPYTDELYHDGTKGMRWGIRRYQNKDGTLTPLGKERLRKYKDNQTKWTNTFYNYDIKKTSRKEAASKKKYERAKLNNKSDKTIAKYKSKYETSRNVNSYMKARKKLELEKIRNMSYETMKKEKKDRAITIGKAAVVGGIMGGIGVVTGIPQRYIRRGTMILGTAAGRNYLKPERISIKEDVNLLNKYGAGKRKK